MARAFGIENSLPIKVLQNMHQWWMLIINDIKGFNQLTDQQNAVFLIYFIFKNVNRHTILGMVENGINGGIRVFHGSVERKKGKVQIIACKYEVFLEIKEILKLKEIAKKKILLNINRRRRWVLRAIDVSLKRGG